MSITSPSSTLHDTAVRQIARSMFSFANGEVYPGLINPTWGTYTNVAGEQNMPVHHRWEGTLWPDIVMVDTERANSPRLIVEVETEETINETTLDRVWKLDMDECPIFYLFVPAGTATKAAELLLKFRGMCKIPRALYTYEFDDLYNVVVTPV
ncbi:hypothetical protein H5V45_09350 [Nocardioides sp. KIGAM211]|uniref:Restriction endonuclease domain-containing protein n=1 Tax=Nocardioides luti TaxID=2761101 RepID=A0A7X0RFU5_9ACTN|nr:hypothetical protein [Nocardioides luti]MBB6627528.1 hypothetical protein [Nocardioides luti]